MSKFKNKYRIESHRKPNWDYSSNGLYFLTIVTQNRVCNLGEILNQEMILSDFGKIVENEWFLSFDIRKELILDEFIIMPNHLHAIVEISDNQIIDARGSAIVPEIPQFEISLNEIKRNMPIRLPKSISSFVAGFKSSVNTKIDDYIDEHKLSIPKYNKNNHFFQPNYHDHIIRNHIEYENIKNYIKNNPLNWNKDSINK